MGNSWSYYFVNNYGYSLFGLCTSVRSNIFLGSYSYYQFIFGNSLFRWRHCLLPFVIRGFSIIHLLFLHTTGSRNPLGLNRNLDKIPFHPYFSRKDLLGIIILLFLFFYICLQNPWLLGDPENFIPANPLVTPVHIQPEWYFLFAYAILRSIPNKLGGVVALALAVMILYILPFYNSSKFKSLSFYPFGKVLFWLLVVIVILLT